MATRRNSLIPPPPPVASSAERRNSENDVASTPRGTVPKSAAKVGHTAQLSTAYRGKSSGEFQRVGSAFGGDTNTLVAEAEQWLPRLTTDDNYRRLLQLAILRRDPALLSGLLDVIRQRRG